MWKEVNVDGDGVLGAEFSGRLSKEDFETMHTWLDRKLAAVDKPALVIFWGAIEGYKDVAALWADLKIDIRHGNDFSRVALVADQKWIEWWTKALNLVVGTDLKLFKVDDRQAALAWARGDNSDADT